MSHRKLLKELKSVGIPVESYSINKFHLIIIDDRYTARIVGETIELCEKGRFCPLHHFKTSDQLITYLMERS